MRGDGNLESSDKKVPFARSRIPRRARWVLPAPRAGPAFARMAPRNLRGRRRRTPDSDEDDPQTLQERIDDARTLIKSRAKAKAMTQP